MQEPEDRMQIHDRIATPAGRPRTAAVLVAAGGSTRMGEPKQRISLLGIPVIARTLLAFEAAGLVDEIVLVTRREDMRPFGDICREYGITKAVAILSGGDSRQASAARGVRAAEGDYLAIHDGARPLVRPTLIDAVITAAWEQGAAAAAVPVKDTIKRADADGLVLDTPPRQSLWAVQTPQVFERERYLRALRQAETDGVTLTDDCQLMERTGQPVRLVPGDHANMKLTTPEDVAVAQALLRERGERF